MEGSRVGRKRRSGGVALSSDLHFDKKSRGKFSLRSPVVSYLIPYRFLSHLWSLQRIRDVLSSFRLLAFPSPAFSSHIPVLFLPHYAGLVYPGLVPHSGLDYHDGNLYSRGRCQLRRRDAEENARGNERES